ncbi:MULTISPECIES: DNA repair protein RadA [Rickettsieae]|uniref:DNA repair protein RadA n=1 Tax=Rickettsieae TaxID=33988 RepID=UPI000B9B744E|nr:DNA repair protein RadA [Rickettsia endosymbiont of Culicoides newsteadi]MDN3030988.1 DNA repair protein RadA [Candidatus Tisiphia sp.]OZG32174.1 DNA repair protein RadA [Rickettsia endosymbiont of Culicoides newsteadi]HJD64178.1 DNA repair protein RadA [Rickettsia endosymbiont of Sericostoma sp.]
MSKIKKQYICTNCGNSTSKWTGQCFDCGLWGGIEEEIISQTQVKLGNKQEIQKLDGVVVDSLRIPTPIKELNRVLGGGLVCSSAILIGGDPGIGKSTLLLHLVATSSCVTMKCCLYVTGEESIDQIKLRALRLGLTNKTTSILAATSIEDIISTIDADKNNIDLVVIDSIQTMVTRTLSSPPGTISQIRACANELVNYAKHNNIIILLSCHVTKDGQLAGPKLLEHLVDTVLYFEGDHNSHFRILRSIKNRFGGVGEIGVFEMTASGLIEVSSPSELFLMKRDKNVSGTTVFAGIEGSRPLLIEIQALIAPSNIPMPRRSVVGWDLNRLAMIIAVLNVRFGLNLSSHEVYLSVAGGLKISDPASDLAVAAALISAAKNKAVPEHSIFFGEIGLSGEIRKVTAAEVRIKEATKLGFNKLICSKLEKLSSNLICPIGNLKELKELI